MSPLVLLVIGEPIKSLLLFKPVGFRFYFLRNNRFVIAVGFESECDLKFLSLRTIKIHKKNEFPSVSNVPGIHFKLFGSH